MCYGMLWDLIESETYGLVQSLGEASTGNHWSDPDPAGHRAECTAASSDH